MLCESPTVLAGSIHAKANMRCSLQDTLHQRKVWRNLIQRGSFPDLTRLASEWAPSRLDTLLPAELHRNWGTEELTRSADMWRLWSCRLLHQVAHLSPTKKEEDKNKTLRQRMLGCGVAGVGDIGEVVRLITEIANGYWHDFECSTHAQIVHLLRSDMFTDVIWT